MVVARPRRDVEKQSIADKFPTQQLFILGKNRLRIPMPLPFISDIR